MESILIIKNEYEIKLSVQEQLEQDYKVYFADDTWGGLDAIEEKHIDIFVVGSDGHDTDPVWDFIKELHLNRWEATPIIFISKEPADNLYKKANNYGWYLLSYPVDSENFTTVVKRAMVVATALNEKFITLKKDGHDYKFNVKDITHIHRKRDKYITIYSYDPMTHIEHENEFYFGFALSYFLKRYEITKYIKQTHRSWLVNNSQVKSINRKDMEITLRCGVTIPTSRKYISDFLPNKEGTD